MNLLWIVVLAIVLCLPGTDTITWTSSSRIPDGSHVTGCRGRDLVLPWGFTVASTEKLVNTEWYYVDPQKGDEELLATLIQDNFFIPSNAPMTVEYVNSTSNGAIRLLNVSQQTAGLYEVHVNIHHDGTIPSSSQQTLTVLVADPPELSGSGFQARVESESLLQQSTGLLHVQLSCGTFHSLGNPPLTVKWRTPTNVTLNSTSYANGIFYLDIDSTHPSGDYTCFVQDNSHSLNCVDSSSPLLGGSTVSINNDQLQLTLLQSQLQSVTAQNANLTQLVNGLVGRLTALEQTNSANLAGQVNALQAQNSNLTGQVQQLTGEVSRLKADNTQLHQQDVKLTEQIDNVTDTLRQHILDMRDFLELPENCQDVQRYSASSGMHTLFSRGRIYHAYCDQKTEGGGWTVIQRREDGSEDFFRGWKDYDNGFGDVMGEHWLGLEKLYLLTSSDNYTLRVELEDFSGNQAWALYSNFTVAGPTDLYTLTVSGYSGNAGDSLRLNDKQAFTTIDNDNDLSEDNCAVSYHGGFWYGDCSSVNVNGDYKSMADAATAGNDGVYWYDWKSTESLKRVVMMLKAV